MAKHAAQHTCSVNTSKCEVTDRVRRQRTQNQNGDQLEERPENLHSSWLCAVMILSAAMMLNLCLKYVHIDFFNLSHGWWFLFTFEAEGSQTLQTAPLISSFFKAVFGYTYYISPRCSNTFTHAYAWHLKIIHPFLLRETNNAMYITENLSLKTHIRAADNLSENMHQTLNKVWTFRAVRDVEPLDDIKRAVMWRTGGPCLWWQPSGHGFQSQLSSSLCTCHRVLCQKYILWI